MSYKILFEFSLRDNKLRYYYYLLKTALFYDYHPLEFACAANRCHIYTFKIASILYATDSTITDHGVAVCIRKVTPRFYAILTRRK